MKLFNLIRVGLGIVLGGLLSGGLLANPAIAASIQYSFAGDVDHVQNRLSSQFDTDQVMSGTMTVDSTGPISPRALAAMQSQVST